MSDLNFNKLDLNLLRVFDALLAERSVTRAANRLNLTQSTISHALGRLRRWFKDDLLIAGVGGMKPTPFANEIGIHVSEAMRQLQVALTPPSFVPEETRRRFAIACGDYTATLLIPPLIERMRKSAPEASLELRPVTAIGVAHDLDSGRVDLAINSFGKIPPRFILEPLFDERAVWVISEKNPAANEPLTLERLTTLPLLALNLTSVDNEIIDEDGYFLRNGLEQITALDGYASLQKIGMDTVSSPAARIVVPNCLAAAHLVSTTDLAALLPRRFAQAIAKRYHLVLFDPPQPVVTSTLNMLWHERYGDQPAVRWLRALMHEVTQSLGDASETP